MPPLDASPLPVRRANMTEMSPSRSSPFGDDLDEATIPCSPAAFLPPFRGIVGATQSAATQPTQILSRPGLNGSTQER